MRSPRSTASEFRAATIFARTISALLLRGPFLRIRAVASQTRCSVRVGESGHDQETKRQPTRAKCKLTCKVVWHLLSSSWLSRGVASPFQHLLLLSPLSSLLGTCFFSSP